MQKAAQTVRIIGGRWRSRRISFANLTGLRPTQDRIRETLFNWLQLYVPQAKCLDLFAGSGVLGFEALSRGADYVCFVDQHAQVIADLEKNARLLAAEPQQYTILHAEFPKQLSVLPVQPFDIIFLDPPFGKGLLPLCIEWLHQSNYWRAGTWIYIEREIDSQLNLPANWLVHRHQQTRSLIYEIICCQ